MNCWVVFRSALSKPVKRSKMPVKESSSCCCKLAASRADQKFQIERNLHMKKSSLVGWLWMGMLLAAASAWADNLPGDAEAATHGDEAASVQLVEVRAVIMEAGGEAWIADGLPTLIAAESGHGSAAPAARSVKLPQRIAAAELKRMLMDLPGTFEIVDVRPPAQYADFSLPGSINADISDVIANPAYLNGTVPLIIVDRDGSLAMAVGGILSQRTQRSIRVLYGGLEAYWNDSATPLPPVAPAPASVPGVKPAAPGAAPATPAAPAPVAPETPKKKSAGC